jgi:hypothetical protein
MYSGEASAFLSHENSWQGGLVLALVCGILFAFAMSRVGSNDE